MTQLKNIDLTQLAALATAMIECLPSKLTLGLHGTLGAGKTTFVQFIAKAASIETDSVTSPTFTLLQTHQGKIKLHHLDAYRIHDEDEFLEIGVEELFEDDAWTLIEWANRVPGIMPNETLWVQLDLTDHHDRRNVTLSCQHPQLIQGIFDLAEKLQRAT
ncbi:tRNA (adenosine(37)-N6)-threonylcarbamoyltransferase complex ATPase subunit type 1 TsaE [bacterium]|nr:tRNA (adenosine(37)-N6)-threonylcarbamoyltransferase complex ATPase subunit type 1 TsaE [bacterium]